MELSDLVGPGFAFMGVIVGGLIAWLTKKTPERKSPEDSFMDQIEFLDKRITGMQEQITRADERISGLEARLREVSSEKQHLLIHASALTGQVVELGADPVPPPPQIVHLFE